MDFTSLYSAKHCEEPSKLANFFGLPNLFGSSTCSHIVIVTLYHSLADTPSRMHGVVFKKKTC